MRSTLYDYVADRQSHIVDLTFNRRIVFGSFAKIFLRQDIQAATISVSRSLRFSEQEEFTRIRGFSFLSFSFLRTRDTCVDVRRTNLGQKVAERKDKVKRDALFTCSGSL